MKITFHAALFPVDVATTEGAQRTLAEYLGREESADPDPCGPQHFPDRCDGIPHRPLALPLIVPGGAVIGAVTSIYRDGSWVYGRGWASSRTASGCAVMARLLLLAAMPVGADMEMQGPFPDGPPYRYENWKLAAVNVYTEPGARGAWTGAKLWLAPETMDTWWVRHLWLPATGWLRLRAWWLKRREEAWPA